MEETKNNQMDGIKRAESSEIKKSRDLVLLSIGEKIQSTKTNYTKPIRNIDGLSFSPKITTNNSAAPVLPTLTKEINTEIDKPITRNYAILESALPQKKPTKKTESRQTKEKLPKTHPQENATRNKQRSTKIIKGKPEDFRLTIKRFFPALKTVFKKNLYSILLFFSIFVFLYLALVLIILNLKSENTFLQKLSNKIFIPAVISKDGILNLSEYYKIKEKSLLVDESRDILNQNIATSFLLNRLYKNQRTTDIEKIRQNLSFDLEVNLAPYNRIKKIKETINEDGNFTKVAMKFGDVGQANISPENVNSYDFGPKIGNLQKDETSDIITTSKGYYIVHCFLKEGANFSLSYVFIPSLSLDDYLKQELANYKFWKLTKN